MATIFFVKIAMACKRLNNDSQTGSRLEPRATASSEYKLHVFVATVVRKLASYMSWSVYFKLYRHWFTTYSFKGCIKNTSFQSREKGVCITDVCIALEHASEPYN